MLRVTINHEETDAEKFERLINEPLERLTSEASAP